MVNSAHEILKEWMKVYPGWIIGGFESQVRKLTKFC